MAERRMFSKSIVDSDLFLDMPLSAQCLYFHLAMRADDEGFVNNPKKIQRLLGTGDDDAKILISKQFIIPFDSGVVVIRHWRIHNYLRTDRFKPTLYRDERSSLELDDGEYILSEKSGIPNDYQRYTQDSIGKVSIVESIEDTSYLLPRAETAPARKDGENTKDKTVHQSKNAITSNDDTVHQLNKSGNSTDKPVIQLILNDKSYCNIYPNDISHWRELYPSVDVLQQLRNMAGWLESNPDRRKTKRGIKRFITGWLSREQDRGGKRETARGKFSGTGKVSYDINAFNNQGFDLPGFGGDDSAK